MEETIAVYRERYEDVVKQLNRQSSWEKERGRFTRIIDEKDMTIQKLHQKIEQLVEKNYQMEENEVYLKMELEKKQVRFSELEREVKNRLRVNDAQIILPTRENLSSLDQNRQDEFREENDKLKSKARELERENKNLVRKAEKTSFL